MDYLLDTNACVAMLRNQPPAVRNHADKVIAEGSRLAISSIALHELWYGTFKSARVDEGVWRLRMFLAGAIQVLPFDEEDARVSGKIRSDLTSAGRRIGEYDTLIGGQCLRHGMTLVTNNLFEFRRIQGLNCVDWTG
jgi:tRNA(fMet)-specific endonuclease VapC